MSGGLSYLSVKENSSKNGSLNAEENPSCVRYASGIGVLSWKSSFLSVLDSGSHVP